MGILGSVLLGVLSFVAGYLVKRNNPRIPKVDDIIDKLDDTVEDSVKEKIKEALEKLKK